MQEHQRRSRFGWLLLSVPLADTYSAQPATKNNKEQYRPSKSDASRQLTGTWIRDDAASELDAYDRMLGLMQLSGLQRTTALRLIEGLELDESTMDMSIKFLTVVPFFKVTEKVAFGAEVQQQRRDLRPGQQTAKALKTANGIYVEMAWPEPVAGRLAETYHVSGDKLFVRSEVEIGGQAEATTVVRFAFPRDFTNQAMLSTLQQRRRRIVQGDC